MNFLYVFTLLSPMPNHSISYTDPLYSSMLKTTDLSDVIRQIGQQIKLVYDMSHDNLEHQIDRCRHVSNISFRYSLFLSTISLYTLPTWRYNYENTASTARVSASTTDAKESPSE